MTNSTYRKSITSGHRTFDVSHLFATPLKQPIKSQYMRIIICNHFLNRIYKYIWILGSNYKYSVYCLYDNRVSCNAISISCGPQGIL